jgi:hypothetical protein
LCFNDGVRNDRRRLTQLHDAVLKAVAVDWENGQLTVDVVRVPGGSAQVVCSGMTLLHMTRREEWGPSVFINSVQARQLPDGQTALVIEIQSGDALEVTAAEVYVTDT